MYTYFTEEEKDGDVLLFLHGWGCDNSIFDAVRKYVVGHTVAIDLWGFGKSQSPPEQGFCVADYGHQLARFIVSRGWDNGVHIVAHSFGARIAVFLAGTYPHLVKSITITGGAGLRRFSFKRSAKQCIHKCKKLLVKLKLMSCNKLQRDGSTDYNNLTTVNMRNTFVKVIKQDLSYYARRIQCPVLLVWGQTDKETPLWMARRYNRLIKNSKLIILNGDHFAFLQHAKQFGGIINAMTAYRKEV